ncbi:MAG: serine--tRNA ligase [Saprospiraceae bacterium]|nr:serine--tRNA ligase [Saprospiraceae bacterium]
MLTLQQIRNEKEKVITGLLKRNMTKAEEIIENIISIDDKRKTTQTKLDQSLSEQNQYSKQIGQLFQQKKIEEANIMKEKVADLKRVSSTLEQDQRNIQLELETQLLSLGNVPHGSVPAGTSEDDNEVIKENTSDMPNLSDNALPHWDLAKKYNLIDFELGTKITGSGFPLYRGQGAKLQRALINFFLDQAEEAGYEEIIPPHLVNEDSAKATGQLPDKEGQMYHMSVDNLYLIPTAEVPITNIFRDIILKEEDMPIKVTGYTPCFRREAGSYGSDVKGLNRVHQFDKVEIIQVAHPKKSYTVLDEMVAHVEKLLVNLNLPYRILRLCGGDLGFTSALTYDFEVFSAAQQKWLEVSSVSNFETYQSNRLKLRYKSENGKKKLAHTLNGSALALARIVAALLENNQTEEGIKIPEILRPYTRFDFIK